MTSASTPESTGKTNGKIGELNYAYYDENYRPMWNRGISRKIGESAFVQQTLPTYRLKWSPYTVCPCLLLIGALFTGMGIGIKKFSDNIQEVIIPYTDCLSVENPGKTCAEIIKGSTKMAPHEMDGNDIANCTCRVHFELDECFNGTVYMYYTLTDFYQNHLGYKSSRDENQLKGNLFDKHGQPKKPGGSCGEYWSYDDTGRIIYPCGLMANSMFNDVIGLFYHPDPDFDISGFSKRNVKEMEIANENTDIPNVPRRVMDLNVPLKRTGIAWPSDREDKYKNHEDFQNKEHEKWSNFTKPRRWKKTLWQLDPDNSSNNGVENEDFLVWMRAAAFPWFRKLYRIVDSNFRPFDKGLPKGNYSLVVQYNYDVSSFRGEKQIVLSTTNMVAGKNTFLSIVYMGAGIVCMFLGIALFIAYKCSRKFNTKSEKAE